MRMCAAEKQRPDCLNTGLHACGFPAWHCRRSLDQHGDYSALFGTPLMMCMALDGGELGAASAVTLTGSTQLQAVLLTVVHMAVHVAAHMALHMAVHMAVHMATHMVVHMAAHMAVHMAVHKAVHTNTHRHCSW